MSVKMLGDGGAGFGKLGDTLAKAIWGDPETELKMARLRQDYDTEAWRRKVMDAQAANQQSVADKNAWELGLRQRSLSPLEEYQAGLVERPVAPEPPAPVEIPTEPLAVTPELAAVETQAANRIPPAAYTLSYEPATDPAMAHLVPPALRPTGEPPAALTGTPKYTTAAGETVPAYPTPQSDPYKDPAITTLATSRERLGERVLPVTPEQQAAYQQTLAEQQAAYEREVAARKAAVDQIVAGGGSAAQVAQGLGIGEGIVKLESRDPTKRNEGEILYTGKTPEAGAGGKAAMELRKEIVKLPGYADLANSQSVYNSMLKSAKSDTKAANMDLIYAIATLEDPGSVVRESDALMVQRTGGFSGAVQAALSYFNEHGDLTPEMKQGLLQVAGNRYGSYKEAFDQQMQQYRGIAERQGLDLRDVIPEFADIKPEATALPPGVTEAMVNAKIQAALPRVITRDQAIMLLSRG